MPVRQPIDPREWYANLPTKRMAAGALILDQENRILLVKPTYKAMWEVPGGIVESDESPRDACRRELREELGLELRSSELLTVDWVAARGDRTEGLMMIFGPHRIRAGEEIGYELPAEELSACALFTVTELAGRLPGPQARRMAHAWQVAIDACGVRYLEAGQTVSNEAAAPGEVARRESGPR